MTPITRKLVRPTRRILLIGSAVPNTPLRTSAPITQTFFLYSTSYAMKKRPSSGRALERIICLSEVPMTGTPSMTWSRYFTSRRSSMVGFTMARPRIRSSRALASRRSRLGRLRKEKKSFITTHGMRDT